MNVKKTQQNKQQTETLQISSMIQRDVCESSGWTVTAPTNLSSLHWPLASPIWNGPKQTQSWLKQKQA